MFFFCSHQQDVVYHNEAYTCGSSEDGSPEFETAGCGQPKLMSDGSLSPQRHQSFIAAVINAIKSAAKHTVHIKKDGIGALPITATANAALLGDENCDESDSTEMLDSETEPCLMMENVLEDVSMPDSHSHNMVSSSTTAASIILSHTDVPIVTMADTMNREEESINNLSQAIFNRQKIELQTSIILRYAQNHIEF